MAAWRCRERGPHRAPSRPARAADITRASLREAIEIAEVASEEEVLSDVAERSLNLVARQGSTGPGLAEQAVPRSVLMRVLWGPVPAAYTVSTQ